MEKIFLPLILILSVFLRVAPVFHPPSLDWDEVSLGYNAYSLLHTGRDEWGAVLPVIFRAFGDFKLPIYVYLAVPFPMMVKIPSIIFGTILVLIGYLFGVKFFSKKVGLITAFLIAVSPWTVYLSGMAKEANVAATLIALGIYCLMNKKTSLGILFLGLSVWTYNSARVFSPLFLIAFKPKLTTVHWLLVTIFFVPMFYQLVSPNGQARFQWLSILDSGAILQLNEMQQKFGGRFVYNKATYFTYNFIKNYLSYYSWDFLFLKGGNHYALSVQNQGLNYLVNLPFFILGLIYLLFKKDKTFLIWFLLAPLAGSITRDAPHVTRAIPMLPLTMLFSAIGVVKYFKYLKLYIFVILISTFYYLLSTFYYYQNYSPSWQYGYSQVITYIKENYAKYDQIIFTKKYGEPHEYLAYFWPWNPESFQNDKKWDYHANWYWVNGIDKITFVNDWEIKTQVFKPKTLIIAGPESDGRGEKLFEINFLDGKPAFIFRKT